MNGFRLIFGFLLICPTFWLRAQTHPGTRTLQFILTSDTLQIDSMLIIQGSFSLSSNNHLYAVNKDYSVLYAKSRLINHSIPHGTLLTARYRIIPLALNQPYRHKESSLIHPEIRAVQQPYLYSIAEPQPLFDREGLTMTGNIARGITLGNNQNAVVNSNLNLQFNGKLSDLDVEAVISDENNPIQPEGNTQQLQDFDRVYIRFGKDRNTFTVGDFVMERPDKSYFMNYYKKSRGLQFDLPIEFRSRQNLRLTGEGAISRGRFGRNTMNGIEGNQGPYQLRGVNGETYIIVISGTEAVYLDGKRLKRGEQNDYTIDYNAGELTFMPHHPITQYSRIVIEFQYADRNYVRSVFHTGIQYQNKHADIRFNYFTEQDHKNQPFLQNLSDSNKLQLSEAGDNPDLMLTSNITAQSFVSDKILYRKTDSLGYSGILVYSPVKTSDSLYYEARFSLVGANRGNYIQQAGGTNGRVFQWVVPIGGIPQGNYEPVTQLVAPVRNQMITLGGTFELSKTTRIQAEVASSIFDKNTLSNKDAQDDQGNAFRLAVENSTPVQQIRGESLYINSKLTYETTDRNFRYIERYRSVEFDRSWNRVLQNPTAQDTSKSEKIFSAGLSLNHAEIGFWEFGFGLYDRSGSFNGLQMMTRTDLAMGNHRLKANFENIKTDDLRSTGKTSNDVYAAELEYAKTFRKMIAGIRAATEQSRYKNQADSLMPGSFAYRQAGVFIKSKDTNTVVYHLEYTIRQDDQPLPDRFYQATTGKIISAGLDYIWQNQNRLSGEINYRELVIHNQTLHSFTPEKTILSRITYDYSLMHRVLTGNTYWQSGSGNEFRRDFQYVKVLPGQGQYIWKDFNEDGIQSANEFLPASSADKNLADYMRIFLPTNTLTRVNSNQFSQTLNITPSAVWGNRMGLKKLASRFSDLLAYKTERKTRDLGLRDFLNPFQSISDSLVLSQSTTLRNTLFYNRSNPVFGCDYAFQNNQSKSYLLYGADSRISREQNFTLRWNLNPTIGTLVTLTQGERNFRSSYFTENDYSYSYQEYLPRLLYQLTRQIRATLLLSYWEGQTHPAYGNFKGTSRKTGIELRMQTGKSGTLNLQFNRYDITFNGNALSPLGYDMLQGLSAGKNALWSLGFQQLIGNNLQLNIQYDGRQSESQQMIHTGKMEARYLF